jgi:DNA-binding CsgD family transcriptional regulator
LVRDDGHWVELTDRFHAAAIDGKGWYPALEGLAEATGSISGELICLGNDAAVHLNIMTNTSPELLEAFIAGAGGDPNINPRVNAGMRAPVLQTLAESDFITPEEHKRHPHYQEFARPFDIPYICLTTLDRPRDGLIGLAVTRTEKQGHINAQQRRAFMSIAPHVRAAVRTHIALEGHGDALLSGALEAVSIPAFICDGAGRVRELTPAAEAIVSSGRGLQLRGGWLRAALPADVQALTEAISHAVSKLGQEATAGPRNSTVIVRRSAQDTAPLLLDVIALPHHRFGFTFVPRVLVLLRGEGVGAANDRRTAILRSVYGMTAAETEIALELLAGKSPEDIAAGRAASVATVRTQIKSVLTKAGARRQIELVARLGRM